jgi:hypothetical protein
MWPLSAGPCPLGASTLFPVPDADFQLRGPDPRFASAGYSGRGRLQGKFGPHPGPPVCTPARPGDYPLTGSDSLTAAPLVLRLRPGQVASSRTAPGHAPSQWPGSCEQARSAQPAAPGVAWRPAAARHPPAGTANRRVLARDRRCRPHCSEARRPAPAGHQLGRNQAAATLRAP